jgi:hypothetical protein
MSVGKIRREPAIGHFVSVRYYWNFETVLVVCAGIGNFSRMKECSMVRMRRLSISDDQIDAILPVAGTLAALIVLLVILMA